MEKSGAERKNSETGREMMRRVRERWEMERERERGEREREKRERERDDWSGRGK